MSRLKATGDSEWVKRRSRGRAKNSVRAGRRSLKTDIRTGFEPRPLADHPGRIEPNRTLYSYPSAKKATRGAAQNRRGQMIDQIKSRARRVLRPTDHAAIAPVSLMRRTAPKASPDIFVPTRLTPRPLPLASTPCSNCALCLGCPTSFQSVWRLIWTVRLRPDSKCRLACRRRLRPLVQR